MTRELEVARLKIRFRTIRNRKNNKKMFLPIFLWLKTSLDYG